MPIEICYGNNKLGVKISNGKVITIEQGKIKEINPSFCLKLDMEIAGTNAYFKNIRIPLYFPREDLNMLKILYIVKGEVSHEVFYYRNSVEIHIDSKLLDVKLSDELKFTRFCGNYGLLFPNYCFGNETYAVFGRNKNDVISAHDEFKSLINYIRKVLLELGFSKP